MLYIYNTNNNNKVTNNKTKILKKQRIKISNGRQAAKMKTIKQLSRHTQSKQ